ncbi:hypothetical protein ATANTOWER_029627 [Ataeniobius toweri]|uniref:Uncharacterized protein n=1 Tax=Ataeniobius toweri TaxID=208326 RepID=A0ABU7BYD4_9TELE|nr:hypothetical protein [Ataeniobius toweri]
MSSDGAPLPYQASYPEPRVSPQTTTPPSNNPTEEKRVIVPAGEASRLPRAGVLRHKMVSQRLANSSSCATPVTESEMCLCQILPLPQSSCDRLQLSSLLNCSNMTSGVQLKTFQIV